MEQVVCILINLVNYVGSKEQVTTHEIFHLIYLILLFPLNKRALFNNETHT